MENDVMDALGDTKFKPGDRISCIAQLHNVDILKDGRPCAHCLFGSLASILSANNSYSANEAVDGMLQVVMEILLPLKADRQTFDDNVEAVKNKLKDFADYIWNMHGEKDVKTPTVSGSRTIQ